jgi:uncharacterized protein YegP (UPF0339 family)
MRPHIEVYKDEAGEWRWRLRAGNGETVADSAEGYATRYNAERASTTARLLMAEAEAAPE